MKKTVAALIMLLLTIIALDATLVNLGKANPIVPENTWSAKAPMPQTEGHVRAAEVNGKLYVMGGSINYEYDPATDNWTEKTPMPTSRSHFGIAVYQNKIYAIGDSGSSPANEVYDPATDTWEIRKPMPANRTYTMANVVGDKIHAISEDCHDVYDVAADSWTTEDAMPYPAVQFGTAVIDKRINVISWNQTQIYNTETGTWSLGASSPIPVSSAGVCATTGVMSPKRIYVIGGALSFLNYTDATQVYNPENDSWTLGAPMFTPRAGLEAAVANDIIFAIGGSRYWGKTENVNEQYITLGYGKPEPSPSPEPTPRTESFPPTLFIGSAVAVVAVAGLGLLVYLKKCHRKMNS
jgi:tellurite resistance-related uncharacterized protein